MTDSVTSYPCPVCRTTATLAAGCPGCGRAPDPVAAEVIRLDGELAVLTDRLEQARQGYLRLEELLRSTRRRRDLLAAQVWRASQLAVAGQPAPAGGPPAVPWSAARSGAPQQVATPETSTRTVQNLLFVLGGLLLCTAAIVFTVVAWATVGLVGRAVILAVLTGLALAVPPLARRRGLTATGETFSVVGLLLVILDGYAARAVNLSGLATWPAARYAALVAGVAALVAIGYGRLTRLAAPWFAAGVLAQPVPPLLAHDARLDSTGWTLTLAALAGMNLFAVWYADPERGPADTRAVRLAGRLAAWVAYGSALAASGLSGLVTLLTATPAGTPLLAGVPLLATTTLLVAGAVVARNAAFRVAAGAVTVVLTAAAVLRPVAELSPPWRPAYSAAVVLLLAVLVTAVLRALPTAVRPGPRVGAMLVTGAVAVPAVPGTLLAAVGVLDPGAAVRLGLTGPGAWLGWQLPPTVLLLTGALLILLPGPARPAAAMAGATFAVLGAPAVIAALWPTEVVGLSHWALPLLDLAVAVPMLFTAVWSRTARWPGAVARAVCGGALAGHALLAAQGQPTARAAVLTALLLTGLGAAVLAGDAGPGHRRAVGAVALAVGLLAVPATVVAGLALTDVPDRWLARAALAATAALPPVLLLVRRYRPAHLGAAGVALAGAALVTGLAGGAVHESAEIYAGLGALLVAAGLTVTPGAARPVLWLVGTVLVLRVTVPLAGAVGGVLTGLVGWLDLIWTGAPTGVGLAPAGRLPELPAGVALLILAVAAALVGWSQHAGTATAVAGRFRRPGVATALRAGLPVAALAVPVLLAAAGARWPAVPAVTGLIGLAGLLTAALSVRGGWWAPVAVPLGVVLTGSGLAGLLAERASTLTGLGLLAGCGVAVGVAGRGLPARLVGWLAGSAAGTALAVAASLALELPLRTTALAVLAVAAMALAGGALLHARRPVESLAVEAFGHGGAVVAGLLVISQARYLALIFTLWGVAVGVRALWPAEPARHRWVRGTIALGSELAALWLLLAAERVALVEAYTLPAAALGLAAGALAVRSRPALNSWVAYGPGLAGALLPSLASVLVAGGQPGRRLLLGAAALLVVLVGASWRRQAPVVLGGLVLAVVALHELVSGWDRVPRWLFLAAGGFALIGLAVTYERRRREMAQLRAAVARMT